MHSRLDRVIEDRDLDALCVRGPGRGGPAMVAISRPEGSYTETRPDVARGVSGVARLFKRFSFRRRAQRGRRRPAAARRGTPARHGDAECDGLFPHDEPVVVACRSCPRPTRRLARRRVGHTRPQVPGCTGTGTTATPSVLVVRPGLDRHRLVLDVIDRAPGLAARAADVRRRMAGTRMRHHDWIRVHGADLPEVAD